MYAFTKYKRSRIRTTYIWRFNKFGKYLYTDENQFGFKKGVGCTHAIYTVHKIVESKGGNTVNLCAIDLSKAFDKVNHHALLLKLMKRNIPITLLDLLEY